MIHSFTHTFTTGILPMILIWTALALLTVAAVQYLRGQAPRVPLATSAAAAAIFGAGALVTQLT